jgi:hypothetical protein
VAARDLLGGSAHRVGGPANHGHRVAQRVTHLVQSREQPSGLVARRGLHLDGEVAGGDLVHDCHRAGQRRGDGAGDEQRAGEERDQCRDADHAQARGESAGRLLARVRDSLVGRVAHHFDELLEAVGRVQFQALHLRIDFLHVEVRVLECLERGAIPGSHGGVGCEELLQQVPGRRKLHHLVKLLAGAPHLALAELELLPALLERLGIRTAHHHVHPLRDLVLEGPLERLGIDGLRDQCVVHLRDGGKAAPRSGEAEERTAHDQRDAEHEHGQDLVADAACEPVHCVSIHHMRSWNSTPTSVVR